MVTSAVGRTPSLITSSAAAAATVAAAAIASLLLLSLGKASCSPTHFHHRNISTVDDHLLSTPERLPSSSSFSASASAADESLRLVPQHRKSRRRASTSGGGNTPKIACYSCTYISEEDFTAGNECNDPFNSAHIPEVMCAGSCHKLKKKLHEGGVMLVRGCMSNCREKVDENGYRHCCTSKLCNSCVSLNSDNHAFFRIICSAASFLFLAARRNGFV